LNDGLEKVFQILSPLESLTEFTQHILPKSAHLIRYYGWCSKKGLRPAPEGGRGTKEANPKTSETPIREQQFGPSNSRRSDTPKPL
jgi:hypothetical protein